MSNNNESSVEWLISQLQRSKDWHRVLNEISQMSSARVDIIEQAKARHKEEIKEAYWNGSDGIETKTEILQDGEQYYNETFGGNDEQPYKKNCLDWLIDKLIEHRYIKVNQTTYQVKYKHEILLEQAKEMYQDELEAVVIKQCAEESTQNASAYAIGYSSGYKRALDLVKWKIDNELNQKNEQQ